MSNIKDEKFEKANRDKALRRLTKRIESSGWRCSKPTCFTRRASEHIVEIVQVRKLSGGPDFEVYVMVQVLPEPSVCSCAIGLTSQKYESLPNSTGKKYTFSYGSAEATVERCVSSLHEFIAEVAEPWLEQWKNPAMLIDSPRSPLHPNVKITLRRALEGQFDPIIVGNNLRQFGLE